MCRGIRQESSWDGVCACEREKKDLRCKKKEIERKHLVQPQKQSPSEKYESTFGVKKGLGAVSKETLSCCLISDLSVFSFGK